MKARETKQKIWRKINRRMHDYGEKQENFSALKICMQCPLVLLIKVCCKQGKTSRIEEGRVLGADC